MPKKDLIRDITAGEDLQSKIKSGIDKIYQVALASYGINSGNVLIEYRYGEPLISHDGITNVGNLIVSDPIENSVISIVRQASERTNKEAGDSTTLTIILTKLAYDYYSQDQFKNLAPRKLQELIDEQVNYITTAIDDEATPITPELLQGVATISAGDKAIGEMITEAVQTVGSTGGITVQEVVDPVVSSEVVNGFSFKQGLKLPVLANDIQSVKSRYNDPAIIILPKLISKNDDILPILDKVLRAGKSQIVLVADVSSQALETIVANKIKGQLDIAIIEPPTLDRDVFLSDLAVYCNTKQFTSTPDSFDVDEYVGSADQVYITLSDTTITGCKDEAKLKDYIKTIEDKDRHQRLTGKSIKIKVGSPTQAQRQELKLRIEDAICTAQTATDYGVVPGGGVFLRDIDNDTYLDIPFKLLTNSDQFYDLGIGEDIYTDRKYLNMVEEGIVDSAKAIREAVVNSHSAVSQLLSIHLALPFTHNKDHYE